MSARDPEDSGLIIRETVGHRKEITKLNQHNFNGLISVGNDCMVRGECEAGAMTGNANAVGGAGGCDGGGGAPHDDGAGLYGNGTVWCRH